METELLSNFYVFENHIDKSKEGVICWETFIYYHLIGLSSDVRPNFIIFHHTTASDWVNTQKSHIEVFMERAIKGYNLLHQVEALDATAASTGRKLPGTQLEKAIELFKVNSSCSDEFADTEVKSQLVALLKATELFGADLEVVLGKF